MPFLLCRSAAQALGTDPFSLLLDAAQDAPAPAPALTGLSGALNSAGSLVNQTVSGVRQNLQSAAAGLNLTVSQVEAPSVLSLRLKHYCAPSCRLPRFFESAICSTWRSLHFKAGLVWLREGILYPYLYTCPMIHVTTGAWGCS